MSKWHTYSFILPLTSPSNAQRKFTPLFDGSTGPSHFNIAFTWYLPEVFLDKTPSVVIISSIEKCLISEISS